MLIMTGVEMTLICQMIFFFIEKNAYVMNVLPISTKLITLPSTDKAMSQGFDLYFQHPLHVS